jgi:CheY-like chemotaxis protein
MKTILLVEDDPNDVFMFQRAWEKAGGDSLQIVTDGQQALDYLSGIGEYSDRIKFPSPCLVLLDLKLPRVMGLEVLRRIRLNSGLQVAVVVLTASANRHDIATAYQLGVNAFLVKPGQFLKLREMVQTIKDFWIGHNIPGRTAVPPIPLVVTAVVPTHTLPSGILRRGASLAAIPDSASEWSF